MKKSFVTVLMVVSLSMAALAAPKEKKQSLTLLNDSEVAGTMLKAGDYQMAVADGTATLYRNGKVAATFAVRNEEVPQKFDYTGVVYDSGSHKLREIRVAGSNVKLVVAGGAAGTVSGK